MSHENETPQIDIQTLEAVEARLHELDTEHRIPTEGVKAIMDSMVDMPDGNIKVIDQSSAPSAIQVHKV